MPIRIGKASPGKMGTCVRGFVKKSNDLFPSHYAGECCGAFTRTSIQFVLLWFPGKSGIDFA